MARHLLRLRLPAALAVMSTLSMPTAGAAGSGGFLVSTFRKWADKAVAELRLPGSLKPSRAYVAGADRQWYRVTASFGGITAESGGHDRPAKVQVVVGDDRLNSSRFKRGRGDYSRLDWVSRRLNLVIDDVPMAIERDLWMATDESYKAAVAQLRAKAAARVASGGQDRPPDWSPARPVDVARRAGPIPVGRSTLRTTVVSGSARLWALGGLEVGGMWGYSEQGHHLLADSSGTSLVQPEGYAAIWAVARLVREDGLKLSDWRQWVAPSAAGLPSAATIADEVEVMGRNLLARRDAQPVDWYEGPVVFEGQAAGGLLRALVSKELRGTPPAPQGGKTYTQQMRAGPRLGRKLLRDGWSVADSPIGEPGKIGAFVFDREGVAAKPVELVTDGFVRDLVMTRVPRADLSGSNGHARGAPEGEYAARLSQWTVTPDRNLSDARFDEELRKYWKATGLKRILVVRRLGQARDGILPRPRDAVWRSLDGSEEAASALLFQSVDRRTLRDIALAGGGKRQHAYLAGWTPASSPGTVRGLPTLLTCPTRLMVDNLEVVFPGPESKPHALPPP